jgi:hypothetical protein
VAVSAGLNDDSALGRVREIVCLERGGSSEERKRRLEHSAMANGDEIFQSILVGVLDEFYNVALLALSESDLIVRKAWAPFP